MSQNPGAALVSIRWAKSTPEQRAEHARKMSAGRWEKTKEAREAAKLAKKAENDEKKKSRKNP